MPIGYALFPNKRVKNQTQTGYSAAAVNLFGAGDPTYKVGAIYIEFKNLADPEDSVDAPEGFAKTVGREYYQALSAPYDYVRVPILFAPHADIDPDVSSNFNNRLTWTAETTATLGAHGQEFSSGEYSKIFGLALVVTPDWDDYTKDIVIARTYYDDVDDQFLRPAVGGVRVGWQQTFSV